MKNLYILPTDKDSNLFIGDLSGQLHFNYSIEKGSSRNQHIYLTSEGEIKEGDWFIRKNKIHQLRWDDGNGNLYTKNGLKIYKSSSKKIILTTDTDLITDGVQSIEDEFLHWFVSNPSCEEVEVKEMKCTGQCWKFIESDYEDTCLSGCELKGKYKIIIPKEPKQETLEEAAERLFKAHSNNTSLAEGHYDYMMDKEDFKEASLEIAQWQAERMYSEEDMIKFAKWSNRKEDKSKADLLKIWFEKFKKLTTKCKYCGVETTQPDEECYAKPKQEYEYIGECRGNNGNGCFMDSCGHNCGCYVRIPKQEIENL